MANMKSKGAFLAMAAMLAATGGVGVRRSNYDDEPRKEKPVIEKGKEALWTVCPNGCQTYFFNKDGEFDKSKEGCVFVCHASNEKNAIRKYNSFIAKNRVVSQFDFMDLYENKIASISGIKKVLPLHVKMEARFCELRIDFFRLTPLYVRANHKRSNTNTICISPCLNGQNRPVTN